jgi:hypothetical protein
MLRSMPSANDANQYALRLIHACGNDRSSYCLAKALEASTRKLLSIRVETRASVLAWYVHTIRMRLPQPPYSLDGISHRNASPICCIAERVSHR